MPFALSVKSLYVESDAVQPAIEAKTVEPTWSKSAVPIAVLEAGVEATIRTSIPSTIVPPTAS